MVGQTLTIAPMFTVPIGEGRLANCERLNRELEELFLARENDEFRNPTPSHLPQREMFESRFNLFSWPEDCVRELRTVVLNAVAQVVRQASSTPPEQLSALTIHNHTWFHITRYGGSFVAHNHPLASWSAVYCVRAGEPVADQPLSGMLRFFDPRTGANAYQDAANANLQSAYVVGVRNVRLTAGQIIVFPSYLYHEVAPFYGSDTRITVATNCWFR
jgi:uncharacterized protein (TIGR02466 family)